MSTPQPAPLSHPVGVLHAIRWNEICPWLILLRSLQVSLSLRVLCLAGVGLLVTHIGWSISDGLCGTPAAVVAAGRANPPAPDEAAARTPSPTAWNRLSWPWPSANWREAWSKRPFWARVCRIGWTLVVWAFLGTAIARICAMQLTREETISFRSACQTGRDVFSSALVAPVIVLTCTALLCLPLVLAGWLMRVDALAWLPSLAWLLVLLWGLGLALLLTGLLVGWPLLWATLAVERSDAFDAISRTYAYVYQRPLHLLFYLLVASLLGLLGFVVVVWFATCAQQISEGVLAWAAGGAAGLLGNLAHPDRLLHTNVIRFWQHLWMTWVAAYPLGYLWSAATGIYLLLRSNVDSTEMDEIRLAATELPQGLPELVPDAAGLPAVQQET